MYQKETDTEIEITLPLSPNIVMNGHMFVRSQSKYITCSVIHRMVGGHSVLVKVPSLLLRPGQYRDKTITEQEDMKDRFFPQYTFTNMQGLGWDPLILAGQCKPVDRMQSLCQHLFLQVSLRCRWNSQDCFVNLCKM